MGKISESLEDFLLRALGQPSTVEEEQEYFICAQCDLHEFYCECEKEDADTLRN